MSLISSLVPCDLFANRPRLQDVVKKVHITKPTRDLRQRLLPPSSVKLKDDEMKSLLAFIDLLEKCTALDPAKRITPKEALSHPFIRG